MPTLVLRNVPDELYQQLKDTAKRHRRSMTQEAILSLHAGLTEASGSDAKPTLDDTLSWLQREVWPLPVLDRRHDDDILGYNAHGYSD